MATGLAAALSGCTLANAITPPIESQLYPTITEARGSDATIDIPSWVPDDATLIRIKENSETGAKIMQFGDPAPEPIGGPCDASIIDNAPPMQDTWWPQNLPVNEATCQDGWHIVFMYGSQYFAWTP
ncbi:hypothetical protein ITJ64_02385 [Herbiconiux sp. VKM Ac-1786]|jgi:hypothetical protein|uniref:hypothetical protein n=1 Tax=Herbiconiux sp. VKM Ac-1786 TaxID=2783824 RepID=UPI00188C9B15|nr:hypothetical protein [Herbiconiux sp. VKM Ac-1786]MBF4571355.1 hypothetical protein [Herbiconiux sp. VKM Ac-1786]